MTSANLGPKTLAEQALEYNARVGLHGEHPGRRAPTQRVNVAAGVADGAASHGCKGLGGDFEARSSGSALIGGPGSDTWPSTDGMVADVQSWLDDPDANFGWLLRGNESGIQTAKRFDSRENGTAGNRPQLTIDFMAPA